MSCWSPNINYVCLSQLRFYDVLWPETVLLVCADALFAGNLPSFNNIKRLKVLCITNMTPCWSCRRGVRLCLWTAATNGPVIHLQDDMWVWRPVEWYRQGKTEELWDKPVPVPLCLLQIPHEINRARKWASAVRGWRLTAWAMAYYSPEQVDNAKK
jgi:hypothetical protein